MAMMFVLVIEEVEPVAKNVWEYMIMYNNYTSGEFMLYNMDLLSYF